MMKKKMGTNKIANAWREYQIEKFGEKFHLFKLLLPCKYPRRATKQFAIINAKRNFKKLFL